MTQVIGNLNFIGIVYLCQTFLMKIKANEKYL